MDAVAHVWSIQQDPHTTAADHAEEFQTVLAGEIEERNSLDRIVAFTRSLTEVGNVRDTVKRRLDAYKGDIYSLALDTVIKWAEDVDYLRHNALAQAVDDLAVEVQNNDGGKRSAMAAGVWRPTDGARRPPADFVRRCHGCGNPDHVVRDCPRPQTVPPTCP